MLCATFILIAIISCGAREITNTTEPEKLTVSAVSIAKLVPGTDSRIIGGSPTSITAYPYTVQVLNNRQLSCGGSLLTIRHVLSAGHCFVDSRNGVALSPTSFSVRVGATNLNEGGTVRSVSTIIVHERYSHWTHDYDVAVLVLSSSLQLTNSIQKASIPLQGQTLNDNSTVVVVGWGRTNVLLEGVSNVLRQVSIRTVNRTVCRQRYDYLSTITNTNMPITENMICAGLLDIGGADACQGDSGGPLIYNGVVVGITSWGYSCAQPAYPGVYAKVSQFSTWINQTVTRYQGNGSAGSQAGIIALLMPLIFLMVSV